MINTINIAWVHKVQVQVTIRMNFFGTTGRIVHCVFFIKEEVINMQIQQVQVHPRGARGYRSTHP